MFQNPYFLSCRAFAEDLDNNSPTLDISSMEKVARAIVDLKYQLDVFTSDDLIRYSVHDSQKIIVTFTYLNILATLRHCSFRYMQRVWWI
jgi:hypothetical protein